MMRIGKLTDYAIVLLTYFAREGEGAEQGEEISHAAPGLAALAQLPLPTVSKILKALSRGGLLISQRGAKGGYRLTRPAQQISVAEIIAVLEGPIALTECSTDVPGLCELEPVCPVRSNWRKINLAVRDALEGLTLAAMTRPLPLASPSSRAARSSIGRTLVSLRNQP
jgi:FeS assembly SUF system regulator